MKEQAWGKWALVAAAIIVTINANGFTPCASYTETSGNVTPTCANGCNGKTYDYGFRSCNAAGSDYNEDCTGGSLQNRLATIKLTCMAGACTAASPGDGTTYSFPTTAWATTSWHLGCIFG